MSSNVLTQYCGVFKGQFMIAIRALNVIHKACLPAPPIIRPINPLRFVLAVVINTLRTGDADLRF